MDPLTEAIFVALDAANEEGDFAAEVFEQTLSELGFMIVPIEDPTNLRYGVDE